MIDQIITALDEDYITEIEYKKGRALIETALRLLNGYINYLKNQKNI